MVIWKCIVNHDVAKIVRASNQSIHTCTVLTHEHVVQLTTNLKTCLFVAHFSLMWSHTMFHNSSLTDQPEVYLCQLLIEMAILGILFPDVNNSPGSSCNTESKHGFTQSVGVAQSVVRLQSCISLEYVHVYIHIVVVLLICVTLCILHY